MQSSCTVIGICGGSASGKTWLCRELSRHLGSGCADLSLDDFYLDRSHLPTGRRARLNFDHPRAIDWPLLEQTLEQLRSGRHVEVPGYDFATHSRRAVTRRVACHPVVLLDGLWLFRRVNLRRQIDLKVFVQCPAHERLRRRLLRDVAERGRTEADVHRQFREQVDPMHVRFVEPQVRFADMVLPFPPVPDAAQRILRQLRRGAAGQP